MLGNREKIEWINYWIEDANQEKNRICLIGDSVTRQYRAIMNNMLKSDKGEKWAVDLLALSYSMLDSQLIEETRHFFEYIGYQYKYIVLHIGTHHGFWIHCKTDDAFFREYQECLVALCKLLSNYCTDIITVAGTPENGIQGINYNEEILARNCILQKVAINQGYPFLDLFEIMKKENYKYVDHVHYQQSAQEYIANRIIEVIFKEKRNEILNMVNTVRDLQNMIANFSTIYIYGNGEKGRDVEQYLKLENEVFGGYIVSEHYYTGQEKTYQLEDIIVNDKVVIIVTSGDYEIFKKLESYNMNYISLSNDIYIYIKEFIGLV